MTNSCFKTGNNFVVTDNAIKVEIEVIFPGISFGYDPAIAISKLVKEGNGLPSPMQFVMYQEHTGESTVGFTYFLHKNTEDTAHDFIKEVYKMLEVDDETKPEYDQYNKYLVRNRIDGEEWTTNIPLSAAELYAKKVAELDLLIETDPEFDF